MNPIVVNSGDQRRKLNLREKITINNGDVVELIPGQYFFKYVSLVHEKNLSFVEKKNGANNKEKNVGAISSKRKLPESNQEAVTGSLEAKQKNETPNAHSSVIRSSGHSPSKRRNTSSSNVEEAISDFNVSNEELPLTFRLMRVQGLPAWANTTCVSIGDVVQSVQNLRKFLMSWLFMEKVMVL
ncbi:hypothetical protein Ancab_033566 [Ancistrocladus abbreviatus]